MTACVFPARRCARRWLRADGDVRSILSGAALQHQRTRRARRRDWAGKIGFPTANIQLKHNRPPLSGIFVVQVHGEGLGVLQGVASLGVRPTVKQDAKPVLEVHLFDFAQQIYNSHLRVEFLQKLRDEEKFPDLETLTRQIALDVEHAKHWFEPT